MGKGAVSFYGTVWDMIKYAHPHSSSDHYMAHRPETTGNAILTTMNSKRAPEASFWPGVQIKTVKLGSESYQAAFR